MTPQLQSRIHPNGDCVRACISTLLDLPITEVPDWLDNYDYSQDSDETKYPVWYVELQDWLAARGFVFLEVQLDRRTWMPLPFPAYAIFIGPRTGAHGTFRHAIVGKCEDGRFIPIFDPAGGDAATSLDNGHVEAVCFLVPVDPAATKFKAAPARKSLRAARANGAPPNGQN